MVNCEDQVTDDKSGQTSSRLPRIPRVKKRVQMGQPLYPPRLYRRPASRFATRAEFLPQKNPQQTVHSTKYERVGYWCYRFSRK